MAFMVSTPLPLRRPAALASRGRGAPPPAATPPRMAEEVVPVATSDRILIRPTPAAQATPSGLLLTTGAATDRPTTGTVIAVGPGLTYTTGEGKEPMPVRVGDHVLWDQYDGLEMAVPGVEGKLVSVRARNLAAYW